MQPALGLGMLWSGRYQGFTPPSRCALRRAHPFALECILFEDGGDAGSMCASVKREARAGCPRHGAFCSGAFLRDYRAYGART
jgi:hypothetical protein